MFIKTIPKFLSAGLTVMVVLFFAIAFNAFLSDGVTLLLLVVVISGSKSFKMFFVTSIYCSTFPTPEYLCVKVSKSCFGKNFICLCSFAVVVISSVNVSLFGGWW